jgi:hypothetical protein
MLALARTIGVLFHVAAHRQTPVTKPRGVVYFSLFVATSPETIPNAAIVLFVFAATQACRVLADKVVTVFGMLIPRGNNF